MVARSGQEYYRFRCSSAPRCGIFSCEIEKMKVLYEIGAVGKPLSAAVSPAIDEEACL
jgi:hypothetical protein